MKKPVVDYRELRLSNICEKRFSHLFLLLTWFAYFIMFFLTENLISAEKCHVIHCFIDDIVPFNEYFSIFYCSWYFLIVFSLGYFLLYDIPMFCNLQTYIAITQFIAVIIYIVYPSRQDLRPEKFPRENFFSAIMGLIYQLDTNTGVFPSLHAAYSIGIASCWLRRKETSVLHKCLITIWCFMICMSVMFVKQHSFLDVAAAVPVCAIAEYIVFSLIRNGD